MNYRGDLIARLRREAGYTQKSLADALHVTDKAVSKWERGLSRPDSSLLPQLSLLLNADLEMLLGEHDHSKKWSGLIDLRNSSVFLGQIVYDKPMVYYLLSHFLLLGIREVAILTGEDNKEYLTRFSFLPFGISISFTYPKDNNLMILDRPFFVFGSDLSRQFQWAMTAEKIVRLEPEYTDAPFLFCPSEFTTLFYKEPELVYEMSNTRSLGRGVICLNMDDVDSVMEAGSFVRMYQSQTGMLIGSLEEIGFRQGIITEDTLRVLANRVPYRDNLLKMASGVL